MSVGPRGAARLARRQQPGQQTVKGRIMAEPRSAEPAQLRLIVAQQLGDDEQQHPGLRLLVWVVAGGIAVAVQGRLLQFQSIQKQALYSEQKFCSLGCARLCLKFVVFAISKFFTWSSCRWSISL